MSGVIIGSLSIINDILSDRDILPWGSIGHFSFFVFLILFAAILANRSVRLNNEVEELNLNLEKKVDERTGELEEAMDKMESLNNQLIDINVDLETAQTIADRDLRMAANVQTTLFPKEPPQTAEWDMAKNDTLLLYSDCLTESMKADMIPYERRLVPSFQKAPAGSAQQILDSILKDFYAFMEGAEIKDDLTVIVIKRKI
ncbi:MAG: SpoIIE family protein phosphatase [bacterium]|nr:SpoIIE family protein phosphatase [bacterium]